MTGLSTSPSIVQRLGHRSLSSSNLGITVHQHFGYCTHFLSNGAFGARYFERGFVTYASLSDFCITLVKRTQEGLCSCIMVREGCFGIHGRVCDMLYTKMGFSGGVLPYIPPRLQGPRWAISKEKTWQEF